MDVLARTLGIDQKADLELVHFEGASDSPPPTMAQVPASVLRTSEHSMDRAFLMKRMVTNRGAYSLRHVKPIDGARNGSSARHPFDLKA